MGAACGWCVGFGFRSLVVSSSVRDPRCWFLVCWCCFGCVGSACPACVALCCSALPCVRFVCSGRDELIVHVPVHRYGSRADVSVEVLHCEYEFIEFTLQLWRAMNLNSFSDEFNV